MRDKALVVMMRAPEPGSVKTRLVPPLTHEGAATLYEAFLSDIFNRLGRIGWADIHVVYTPETARQRAAMIVPPSMECFPQAGSDLGERMYNAFENLLGRGYKRVVMIGSDSPDMPIGRIKEAFSALKGGTDVVFGPALDGGYYLIGLKRPTRLPFEGVAWSTATVLSDTLEKIKGALSFKLIKPWHDIDTVEDLKLLKKRSAPRTFEASLRLGLVEG